MEGFDKNSLGNMLQRQMEQRGIRLSELANSTGLPQTTVSRIVTGATDNPTVKTLIAISDYFGVSMDFLLERAAGTDSQVGHKVQRVDKFYKKIPVIPWAYIKKWIYNKESFLSSDQSLITDRQLSQEAFALKISTDSYKKYFSKGTFLIIDKQDEYYSGDYILASINRNTPVIQEIVEYSGSLYMNSLTINAPSVMIGPDHTIYGKIVESRKLY